MLTTGLPPLAFLVFADEKPVRIEDTPEGHRAVDEMMAALSAPTSDVADTTC